MRGLLGHEGGWRADALEPRERPAVLEHLRKDMPANLLLVDLSDNLGRPPGPRELPPRVLGLHRGAGLEAVASLRPSIALDSQMPPEAVEALLPHFEPLHSGLVKSAWNLVTPLWDVLSARGRKALVDRPESAFALRPENFRAVPRPGGATIRAAVDSDLEVLVVAARASLREEDRPDPFVGDPVGFRRWVQGRLHRARVVEVSGRAVFVGYADVRRSEGWLIQGVYTAPEMRRRGYAAAGMSALAEEAFAAGADHVQLAVVEGNEPARRLYEGMGFEGYARLRTVLFV